MVVVDTKQTPPVANNAQNGNVKKLDSYKEREKWDSPTEFLLSCIGLAVGIGNVWRFPYLAYQNGGGAFLVAYMILLILVGKPIFFMELAIGQFAGTSPVEIWRCFPLAKGIGVAMVVMSVLVAIYYNVVMTYTLYYVGQSLRSQVPWKECSSWWGADSNCYVRSANQTGCKDVAAKLVAAYWNQTRGSYFNVEDNLVSRFVNVTSNNRTVLVPEDVYITNWANCHNGTQTASEQFWERYVLQLTENIEELGVLKWDLTVTLFVCWIIVALGLIKGIKSSGKVVYFTATFPYIILVILVVYGCTLPGATEGLKYFFIPVWSKLLEIRVWRAAAEQMLFSMSIGFGCLIMYSSYNKFENKLYRDAIFVSILDFATSIMAGVVIFAILGNLSHEMGINIVHVAKSGQGLAFVAYPEALARLPIPQLWSVLFFFMLFLLAIDSQFSYLETYFTAIFDKYPYLKRRKALITCASSFVFFIAGLPCVTQGGQYVFNLMDTYAGGYACIFVAIMELIAVMWGYGADRFADDIEFMLGSRPGLYWIICWKYISPLVLIFVVIYGLSTHKVIEYSGIPYPTWAENLGWFLMVISTFQIPIWAIVQLYRYRKEWRKVIQPHQQWGPADPETRRIYHMKRQEDYDDGRNGKDNFAMSSIYDGVLTDQISSTQR